MTNLEDRIQATLAAEISLQITIKDSWHRVQLEAHVQRRADRLTEAEMARIAQIGSRPAKALIINEGDHEWLLIRHPDYIDVWYVMDGVCPVCRTDIAKSVRQDGHTTYVCGICGRWLAEYEQIIVGAGGER